MVNTTIQDTYQSYWANEHDTTSWYLTSEWPLTAPLEDAAWIIEHLSRLQIQSLLDLGCGSGRLFPLWDQYRIDVTAIDFSERMIPRAMSLGATYGIDVCRLDICAERLPRMFDMVFATQVLLHIPPSFIRAALTNLFSMASRYVAIIDWYDPVKVGFVVDYSQGNSFAHAYLDHFNSFGFEIRDDQLLFGGRNHAWLLERRMN